MALRCGMVALLIALSTGVYGQFTLYLATISAQPDSASSVTIDQGEITSMLLIPPMNVTYAKKKNGKTALYNYNVDTQETSLVFEHTGTITSLQLFPGGKHFSFLSRNKPGSTELVNMSREGGIYKKVKDGLAWESFVWIDDNSVLFIEPGPPNSLNLMAMRPVKQLPIAKNVGLTLARVSNPLALYFVHKLSVDTWSLKQVAMDGSIKIITDTLPEADLFYVNTSGIYLEQEGVIYQLQNNQWKEMSRQFEGKEVIAFQISDAGNEIAVLVAGN